MFRTFAPRFMFLSCPVSPTSFWPWLPVNQMERKDRGEGRKQQSILCPFYNQETGHPSDVTKPLTSSKKASKITKVRLPDY
jgi:hypothetical protein